MELVSVFSLSLQHGQLAAGRSLTFPLLVFRALLPSHQYKPIRPLVNTEDRALMKFDRHFVSLHWFQEDLENMKWTVVAMIIKKK